MISEQMLSPQRTATAFDKRCKDIDFEVSLRKGFFNFIYTFGVLEQCNKWEFFSQNAPGDWWGFKILSREHDNSFAGIVYEENKNGVYSKGRIDSLHQKRYEKVRNHLQNLLEAINSTNIHLRKKVMLCETLKKHL